MWTALVVSLMFAAPPSKEAPAPKETPTKRELFAAEEWYKKQKGEERAFVGLLERAPGSGPGTVGFARSNPYRLVMEEKDKKSVREVHVSGKSGLLTPYVGKKVKLIGKAVDMEVEGKQHHEIWPARVELVAAEGKNDAPAVKEGEDRELAILARGVWPVRQVKPTQIIIRDGEELALRPPHLRLGRQGHADTGRRGEGRTQTSQDREHRLEKADACGRHGRPETHRRFQRRDPHANDEGQGTHGALEAQQPHARFYREADADASVADGARGALRWLDPVRSGRQGQVKGATRRREGNRLSFSSSVYSVASMGLLFWPWFYHWSGWRRFILGSG